MAPSDHQHADRGRNEDRAQEGDVGDLVIGDLARILRDDRVLEVHLCAAGDGAERADEGQFPFGPALIAALFLLVLTDGSLF